MAESAVEHSDDHPPDRYPSRRSDLDRCGSRRFPVQHGASDRRHADERRPRLLARKQGRGNLERGRSQGSGADSAGVRIVFDASDILSGEFTYPDQLEIRPYAGELSATVAVPGSKSITNRALVLAALASYWSECT